MALVDDTKVATELNFGERESSYPVYRYRNVYPANGAERTIRLTSAGELQQTIFDIPAEQVNMGESYLEYGLVVPAQVAYSWVFRDVYGEFNSITYRDTGTQYLTNIRNLNIHNSVVNRLETSAEDLLYNDIINGLVCNQGGSGVEILRPVGVDKALPHKEPLNLSVSALAASQVIPRRIYLKDLAGKHSYLGMAKDSLFPQQTYLEIGWVGNRIGFLSNDNATPEPGGTIVIDALAGSITITNLVLKLAIQDNQDIVKEMKEKIAKGVTISIPWTTVHTLQGTVGAQSTYNLTLDNKQHGRKIQKLIYVPLYKNLPGGSELHRAYDHRNLPASAPKLLTYNTELDNRKLQRDDINIAMHDDYMQHKKRLKNTTYFNKNIYGYYWVHIDAFDYPESNKNGDGSIYTDGYSLDKPTTWSVNKFSGDAANANFNVSIVQGMKLLTVDSTSLVVA